MKRAVAVCGAVAMLLVAASAFAQGNFSGKWAPDADKNMAPAAPAGGGGGGGRGGGAPGPMTITQTATELKIERAGQDGTMMPATVYKLDGKENTVTMGQGEAKVTATMAGGMITISQTQDRGQGPTTTKIVYSMEGADLLVSTTRPGRGGGDPTTTKVYYKKVM